MNAPLKWFKTLLLPISLPPATKLGQGYVFTRVCDSVHGGVLSQHAMQQVSGGGCLLPGGSAPGGAWWRAPGMATAAGGTHPTGMYSCCLIRLRSM